MAHLHPGSGSILCLQSLRSCCASLSVLCSACDLTRVPIGLLTSVKRWRSLKLQKKNIRVNPRSTSVYPGKNAAWCCAVLYSRTVSTLHEDAYTFTVVNLTNGRRAPHRIDGLQLFRAIPQMVSLFMFSEHFLDLSNMSRSTRYNSLSLFNIAMRRRDSLHAYGYVWQFDTLER